MTVTQMTKRPSWQLGYTYSETIADSEVGASIAVTPAQPFSPITCTLYAGSNTGKFQYTTSSDEKVSSETATWIDWDEGNSTGTVVGIVDAPVTGLRGVSVSGQITIEIVR